MLACLPTRCLCDFLFGVKQLHKLVQKQIPHDIAAEMFSPRNLFLHEGLCPSVLSMSVILDRRLAIRESRSYEIMSLSFHCPTSSGELGRFTTAFRLPDMFKNDLHTLVPILSRFSSLFSFLALLFSYLLSESSYSLILSPVFSSLVVHNVDSAGLFCSDLRVAYVMYSRSCDLFARICFLSSVLLPMRNAVLLHQRQYPVLRPLYGRIIESSYV